MKQSNVLALQFACENGKKYNVRIKDAYSDAPAEAIKQLASTIVNSKAFNFDGKQTPYTFKTAVYTTTTKKALV